MAYRALQVQSGIAVKIYRTASFSRSLLIAGLLSPGSLPASRLSAMSAAIGTTFCTKARGERLDSPALSGRNLVWLAHPGARADIYGRSLPSGRTFVVSADGTAATGLGSPVISGRTVVWVDCRLCVRASGLPGFRNTGIYARNVPEGQTRLLSLAGQNPYDPAVSGHVVVWVGHDGRRSDIYGRNLHTDRLFRISSSGTATAPSISGSVVVWQDRRGGTWDIYGRNLRANREFLVARHHGRNYLENPLVSKATVVWANWRSDGSVEIDGEELPTRHKFEVAVIPFGHYNPELGPKVAVSGRFVVWDQTRGKRDFPASAYEVRGKDMSTGREFSIPGAERGQSSPAISGRLVVWVANRQICGASLPAE